MSKSSASVSFISMLSVGVAGAGLSSVMQRKRDSRWQRRSGVCVHTHTHTHRERERERVRERERERERDELRGDTATRKTEA